jgi:uncharacterized protein involved in outer membrane biogenesis
LRKVLIGLLVLLALAAAGLALAPRFVDPADYRDMVAAALRRAVGREVTIAGPIELSFLPVPSLTARDIRVANSPGARDPDLLRIGGLELRLAIAPLFTGRLVFRSVTMADPVLDIERLADGRLNLDLAAAQPEGGTAAGSEPQALPVERIDVSNGRLVYRGKHRTLRLDRLDMTARTAPDGSLGATGALQQAGMRFGFTIVAGRIADRMPLTVTLDLPDAAAQAEFDGSLALSSSGGDRIIGRLKASGSDLASLLRQFGEAAPALLEQRFTAEGELSGGPAALRLDRLAVALGETHGSGRLDVVPGTPVDATLHLDLGQLDLDKLAAAAPPAAAPSPAAGGAALPRDLHAAIAVTLDALLWRGGIVRNLRLRAALADGVLSVEHAGALLPGGSDIALSGRLDVPAGGPRFRGLVEANSDNLRQLLAWLGAAPDGVPADRLRKASLTSRILATRDTLAVDGLDLTLDASRLTGAATIALRQRLGIGARLAVDQLNLDAYLPSAPASGARPAAFAGGVLGDFDANLEASIGTLTWRGQPARDLQFSGTLRNGALAIRSATIGEVAGVAVQLRGAVDGLAGKAPELRASLVVKGSEIGRVLRLAAPDFDPEGRIAGPFSLTGDIDSGTGATALDLGLQALGGTAHVTGDIRPGAAGAPTLDLAVEASHPSARVLLRSLAPGYQPAGGDPGALRLAATLRGTPRRLALSDASLSIGALSLAGEGSLDTSGVRPRIAGSLHFNALDLDRFLPIRQTALDVHRTAPATRLAAASADAVALYSAWQGAAIDLSWLDVLDADLAVGGDALTLAGWQVEQPRFTLSLADTALRIDHASGSLFGGTLDARLALDGAGPPRWGLDLTLGGVDLQPLLRSVLGAAPATGRADFDARLTSTGGSPAEIVAALTGKATVAGKDGALAGVDLAALGKGSGAAPGAGGTTAYRTLAASFQVAQGVARSTDLDVESDAGTAKGSLGIDLPHWLVDAAIALRPAGDVGAAPFELRLSGALDRPEERIVTRSGAASPVSAPPQ